KLYQHWRRIDPATVDGYSRRVLVNAYLSHRRRYIREHVTADPPERAIEDAPESIPADMGAALAALPPRQRILVVLRYLEDMSVLEAAELLGIAEGTVK